MSAIIVHDEKRGIIRGEMASMQEEAAMNPFLSADSYGQIIDHSCIIDHSFHRAPLVFPLYLFKCATVSSLNISLNGLTILPDKVSCLTALTHLNLDSNQLTNLPSFSVSYWCMLTELHMAYNLLSNIPLVLCGLTKLRHLDLQDNEITHLPSGVAAWTNLSYLNLNDNLLEKLPPQTSCWQNLVYLNIGTNRLKCLQPHGGWSKLKRLNVSENMLNVIPTRIASGTTLRTLNVLDNSFNLNYTRFMEVLWNGGEIPIDGITWGCLMPGRVSVVTGNVIPRTVVTRSVITRKGELSLLDVAARIVAQKWMQ